MLRRVIFLLAICAPVTAEAAKSDSSCFPAPVGKPVRVLFIGNSFTYFNDMPVLAEAIARANGFKLQTGLVASGGETLHEHLTSGDAAKGITLGRWDYVVLQEQSSFGDTYLVNGRYRVRPTYGWIEDARALSELARKSGAMPVLLVHWPMQESPEDGPTIEALYNKASRETGACLIRNSQVFARAEASVGRPALYISDKLHPTPLKSYLIAASVVRSLAGRPLHKIPTKVIGEPIDESEGKRLGGAATLVSVTPSRASQVARWAEAVRQGPSDVKPLTPVVPRMPKGQPLPSPAELVGTWSGPLSLYPIPAILTFNLQRKDVVTADVTISSPEGLNRSAKGLPLTIAGDQLQVNFPQGPNGTTILFRAAYVNHQLAGLGHFRSSDGSLEGIGTFSLKRDGKP